MKITREEVVTMVGILGRDTGFVPGSGVRSVHFWRNGFSSGDVRWFLPEYDGCVKRPRISNVGGMERRVASIRELFTIELVELSSEDYSNKEESTDDSLRVALRIFSCEQYLKKHE